jgi:glycosyltransferase involved in cell wall biosynthesis
MRVVHISTFDHGGAGRSARRLHESLLACGHESFFLARDTKDSRERKAGLQDTFTELATRESILFEEFAKWYIDQNRTDLSNTHFSLNEPGVDLSGHQWVREAGVIHLHWVAGFLSPNAVGALQRLKKPVVWTMHDQRPFTGGCHFSAGCEKFKTTCHGCPQIQWDPHLLSEAQLRSMHESIQAQEIVWVSPSRWLAAMARQSALLRNARVDVIPYSIDTQVFQPLEKNEARKRLGLDPERQYLLFGADNAREKRKGFGLLIKAVQGLAANGAIKKRIDEGKLGLLCLGHPSAEATSMNIPIEALGYVNDDTKVALTYSACDFFVLPSIEDNLPNTVMEAMSCARPVVAMANGGIPEMVEHGATGMLARSTEELSQAMIELILDSEKSTRLGAAAREKVLREYPLKKQGENYAGLYEELRAQTKPLARAQEGVRLAPAGISLLEILEKSLPQPVQEHLYVREIERRALARERDEHVKTVMGSVNTMRQQTEYINELKALHEAKDKELKAFLRKGPVKMLRKLNLLD